MKIGDLIRAKGMFEIIRTIGNDKILWGGLLTAVENKISRRTLSFRLRELKNKNFVDAEVTYVHGRPAQLYFLTEKGKRLLELIKEVEKLDY